MRLFSAVVFTVAMTGAGWGFDTPVATELGKLRIGKMLSAGHVHTFMEQSRRWCYWEQDASCRWTDRYGSVSPEAVQMEVSNLWDGDTLITVTLTGTWDGDRICNSGIDYVDTMVAVRGGRHLRGKEYDKLAGLVRSTLESSAAVVSCFDYQLQAVDDAAGTVSLLQRQHNDGAYMGVETDVPVTLHFNPASANALTYRLE